MKSAWTMAVKESFEGCIAGSWIGSAMGAPVEGWLADRIEEEYGVLEKLLGYEHYNSGWERPPGTTEDGIERQKLLTTAIIENGGRIKAHDFIEVIIRDANPEDMRLKHEPMQVTRWEMAKSGIPPSELGNVYKFPRTNTLARASQPLGLINAGDPYGAATDSFEISKTYMRETGPGAHWAALYNAAIAEACKPDATVDSVLDTALEYSEYRASDDWRHKEQPGSVDDARGVYTLRDEILRSIELAEKADTWKELRDEYYKIYYGGSYFSYGYSSAKEVVSKGLGIFAFHEGDPEKGIISAVNFGRDVDCQAAVAGGLTGAFAGSSAIPLEWIEQVNEATEQDPYTNNKRSIEETADGLYKAYLEKLRNLKDYVEEMAEYNRK